MWLRDADTCNTDLCITYFFRHGQRERVEWVCIGLFTFNPFTFPSDPVRGGDILW